MEEAIAEDKEIEGFQTVAWELLWSWGVEALRELDANLLEDRDRLMHDMLQLAGRSASVQRFYAIKPSQNEDTDAPGLIFILRLKKSEQGSETGCALRRLSAKDALLHCGLTLRGDHAPRSGMERGLQRYLDKL